VTSATPETVKISFQYSLKYRDVAEGCAQCVGKMQHQTLSSANISSGRPPRAVGRYVDGKNPFANNGLPTESNRLDSTGLILLFANYLATVIRVYSDRKTIENEYFWPPFVPNSRSPDSAGTRVLVAKHASETGPSDFPCRVSATVRQVRSRPEPPSIFGANVRVGCD